MSDPKQVHIQGDLNLSPGLDTSLGDGVMNITGTNGGVSISGSSGTLDVNGASTLDQVTIDTTDGQFAVSGTNKINFTPAGAVEILSGATSFFRTSAGNIDIDSQNGTLTMRGETATQVISDSTTVAVLGATGVTVTSTANNVQVNAGSNFDVNASSSITMDANASSNFTVAGSGNVTVNTTAGRAIVEGGLVGVNAITIAATNAAGGIDIDAGTGGFDVLATGGGFSIDAQNTASNLSLATNADAQDLTIALTGTSNSSILMSSSGTGADAIKITSSDVAGGLDIDAGTSGVAVDTTGAISLDSAAASNFTVTGAFDLTASSTLGSVIVAGGEAVVDAVQIKATDAAGGIHLDSGTGGISADTTAGFSIDGATASNVTVTGTQALTVNNTGGQLVLQSGQTAATDAVRIYASNGSGGIDIDSGTGGVDILSQGLVSIDATGAASNFSLATSGTAQDLTISVTGNTDSSLFLTSTGTSTTDAIRVNASAGGIDIDAVGQVNFDTTDTVNGIFIATNTPAVPVTIGTATSTTTISGNLIVSGVTTTVNTETLLVEDNLIVINSGGGELGNDGGIVIRRNQIPVDVGTGGDVSSDTGTGIISSTLQSGTATSTLWTIAGGTNITLTTVGTGTFSVGMTLSGTGITGSPTILSFSSGSGGSGSVAVLSSAQTNVVGSIDTITGSIAASTLGPDTLRLNSTASAANDTYNGMWVKITSGTQTGKIRRIKDYIGASRVAILYMTADNAPGFTDGLDLGGTASLNGDGYTLYNSPYVASFYDESADKWVLAFTNVAPDAISDPGPSTVIIQRYASFESGSIVINANGDPATSTLNVNYINETTFDQGVTIEGVNINNGLIGGAAPDVTQVITLPDNATTSVAVSTGTTGAYMIMVDAVQSSSGAGSFLRATGGAFAVFAVASSGVGGAINRLASSKGSQNQRLDADWSTGQTVRIQHKPAFSTNSGAQIPYRVKITKVVA
jgi:hypothetical protein